MNHHPPPPKPPAFPKPQIALPHTGGLRPPADQSKLQLVQNIYNPNNVEITDQDILGILAYFGVQMQPFNLDLYRRAFIHDSYSYTQYPELAQSYPALRNAVPSLPKLHSKHNQRLELLGDGVVELIAKYYIYVRWPGKDEGFITDTKIEMVKNETIGKLAMDMGLQKWYMISRTEEQKGLRTNVAKLGCLFEAFVGAIFLDFNRMNISEQGWTEQLFQCGPGFQVAQIFTTRVFDTFMNWTTVLTCSENYKRPLQELLQCEFKVAPVFDFSTTNKMDGFSMCVLLCVGAPPPRTAFTNGASAKSSKNAGTSLSRQALPVSQFQSFADIHRYLAIHKQACILLGEGFHRKKQSAEQLACKSAIEAIKTYSDFENVAVKTRQKYVALTTVIAN
jgi:dsRNA-specific ribonuclease